MSKKLTESDRVIQGLDEISDLARREAEEALRRKDEKLRNILAILGEYLGLRP